MVHRKQQVLREVNDRILELLDRGDPGVNFFLCECGDVSCASPLDMTVDEYVRARDGGSRVVVAPGHDGSGEIIARTGRFVVVAGGGELDD
jgi:hypothetical protein